MYVRYVFDLALVRHHQVSVSVDYAYAMTALTVLCQFFIGVVALPTPSSSSWRNPRCCLSRCRRCRPINPIGCCCFLFWRARSCCFPAPAPPLSDNERPGFSDAGPSSGMGATRRSDKSGGPVTRTEGGAGSEGPRLPARFEQV